MLSAACSLSWATTMLRFVLNMRCCSASWAVTISRLRVTVASAAVDAVCISFRRCSRAALRATGTSSCQAALC